MAPCRSSSSSSSGAGAGTAVAAAADPDSVYALDKTRTLVETAMLAAVSGLTYLLCALLKFENTLGYFLPLPITVAAMRSGPAAGWKTMTATGFLILVLLGPLRSLSYLFLHGALAAALGAMWSCQANFWVSIVAGALVRVAGQASYLGMTSITMNENLFQLMLSNVYTMLDQVAAAIGMAGGPSNTLVVCMVLSLLLVNGITYSFLIHVIYRIFLTSMGYRMGPLPALVRKLLYAGLVPPPADQPPGAAPGAGPGPVPVAGGR